MELKLNLDTGAVIGKRSFNRTIMELKQHWEDYGHNVYGNF